MPIDEAAGCLAVFFRLLGGVAEGLLETGSFGGIFGYLGSWTVRLVTWGRYKPDPESVRAVLLGLALVVALIVIAGLLAK
jgi:hypothetical protein